MAQSTLQAPEEDESEAPSHLPAEDKAVTKPNLQAMESGDQPNGQQKGNAKGNSANQGNVSSTVDNPFAPGKSFGSSQLQSAEESPQTEDPANISWNYNSSANATWGKGIKGVFWSSKKSKRRTLAGGTIGLIIGGGFLGLSIVSGPLEFIHIAQLMEQFHFSSQENQGNDRLAKATRYIFYTKRDQTQKTRLGLLGNSFANTVEANMEKSGIKTGYQTKFAFFDGYVIDPASSSSPNFEGKSPQEIETYLKNTYPDIPPDRILPAGDGTVRINADGLKYSLSKSLIKSMMLEAGYDKVTTAVGWRIMGERAGITWHPIKKLDTTILKTVQARLKAWQENRTTNIEEGIQPETITTEDGTQKDKNGNPTNPTETNTAQQEVGAANGTTSEGTAAGQSAKAGDPGAISKFQTSIAGKLTFGGVAAAGVLCLAKGIVGNVDNIKQDQVVLPTMRLGMESVSLGGQTMDSQDVSTEQLGFYSGMLAGKDSSGNVTSWNQAQSIQAELGEPQTGGVAPTSTLQSVGGASPFGFLNTPPLSTILGGICSVPGQILTTAISFLGGPVSALVSTVVGAALTPSVENTLSHWLAGEAVDPSPVGGDYGNAINYGSRLAANEQALASGGKQLNNQEALQLQTSENNIAQASFKKQSVAYKLFDPYDYRSLISKIIDRQSPDVAGNVNHYASTFLGIGKTLASLPMELFTSTAHAATPTPYNYGFPAYGFSQAEMDNTAVQNPFQNADIVAGMLSDPNSGPTLRSRALACFNVTLAPNGDGQWDAVAAQNKPVAAYGSSYAGIQANDNCSDNSVSWLRLRFFIFDTETMESAACYEGDEQSCNNIGFAASVATAATGTQTTGLNNVQMQNYLAGNASIYTKRLY